MNIARARGLAEALIEFPQDVEREAVQQVARSILDALEWTPEDEFAAVQRTVGAMVARYGKPLDEATDEMAANLVFVALAGIGK